MSRARLRRYKVVLVGVEEERPPQRRRSGPARRAVALYFSLSWQMQLALAVVLTTIVALIGYYQGVWP